MVFEPGHVPGTQLRGEELYESRRRAILYAEGVDDLSFSMEDEISSDDGNSHEPVYLFEAAGFFRPPMTGTYTFEFESSLGAQMQIGSNGQCGGQVFDCLDEDIILDTTGTKSSKASFKVNLGANINYPIRIVAVRPVLQQSALAAMKLDFIMPNNERVSNIAHYVEQLEFDDNTIPVAMPRPSGPWAVPVSEGFKLNVYPFSAQTDPLQGNINLKGITPLQTFPVSKEIAFHSLRRRTLYGVELSRKLFYNENDIKVVLEYSGWFKADQDDLYTFMLDTSATTGFIQIGAPSGNCFDATTCLDELFVYEKRSGKSTVRPFVLQKDKLYPFKILVANSIGDLALLARCNVKSKGGWIPLIDHVFQVKKNSNFLETLKRLPGLFKQVSAHS